VQGPVELSAVSDHDLGERLDALQNLTGSEL